MEITDVNEVIVASYRYDPYGNMTITVGGTPQTSDPLGQRWGYTGRFHDPEVSRWYYRARYYASEVGRFLARDPISYEGGPNLFEYASSSPAQLRDPSGLDPIGQDPMPVTVFNPALLTFKHVPWREHNRSKVKRLEKELQRLRDQLGGVLKTLSSAGHPMLVAIHEDPKKRAAMRGNPQGKVMMDYIEGLLERKNELEDEISQIQTEIDVLEADYQKVVRG